MKSLLFVALLFMSPAVLAECASTIPLEGAVSIKTCDSRTETCLSGAQAVHDYMNKVADDPSRLSVGVTASPWHFYDAEMRIIAVEELAALLRPQLTGNVKRVDLVASWTGVAPQRGMKSLAQRLSEALKGFPVNGQDGFLWISRDGHLRTTRQAFSLVRGSGPYSVAEGDEAMVSLVAGWPASMEETYVNEKNAEGIMRAGAGWDVFYLCPERALQAFDAAAKLKHPIAAYNAALMRLERKGPGDREAAGELLRQAAGMGDTKAREILKKLEREKTGK